ncbi:MAG: lipopolysaccharide transport periplasmic protein LptA [Lysobacteraceae bacterium]|nr:MAG: lipopolysaccharide transport periplasmic protein LptA [Xanthomonadaceae bacterium]
MLTGSAIAACAIGADAAHARSSDRNQPMDIDAGRQEGSLDGNSVNVFSGGVTITQGTLDIRADRADIHQRGGEVVRAVLTGKQAVLKQQMDDGMPMTAKADRIDYDMTTDVVVLSGNFSVTTPRGTSSGQRLTYDLKSGYLKSGGEGEGRIKLRILPNAARAAAPTKPAATSKP